MHQLYVIAQASGGGGGMGGFLIQLLPFALVFLVFWFLLIRPQRKRQEEHESFLDSLKSGDDVWTDGGLLGTVDNINDNVVTLKIRGGSKVDVVRSKIQGPQSQLDEEQEGTESSDEKASNV